METFYSEVREMGQIRLPPPHGIRVLMMPFLLEDIEHSLPDFLMEWKETLKILAAGSMLSDGTAYLTIDERQVGVGQHHRRPGLHVDGWTEEGVPGSWGGGGWGRRGWITVSSHRGCIAWAQQFQGTPRAYGEVEHLREQCKAEYRVILKAYHVYKMSDLAVHETVAQERKVQRQFIRLSLPSQAGWPISCTPNPRGIKPTGPLFPPRLREFTGYQPSWQT